MLTRCISAESRKLCHSMILPACLLIPIIPAIMGTFNYYKIRESWNPNGIPCGRRTPYFMPCFFFAPLIGLYCSYLWRLEHRHNNWNMIMTAPVPVSCLFFAKLAVILAITLLTQIWMGALYLICGKLVGLPGFCPPEIILWLLRGLAGLCRSVPCSFSFL